MRCTVYRSSRHAQTYLYLADGRDFAALPAELQRTFGNPRQVMRLDLDDRSRLARADIAEVRRRLAQDGFFIQLPPRHPLEDEIAAGLRGRTVRPG